MRGCYTRMERANAIQDYYYKPASNFFRNGPRFFGVELEIDEAGESDRSAWELLSIANSKGEKKLYCKHDGSLSDGFELVTHSMSLSYHMEQMPWERLLRRAVELGYTSHQAGSCGLHVHVSRAAFSSTEAEQDIGSISLRTVFGLWMEMMSCGSSFRCFLWHKNADGSKTYGYECYRQKRPVSKNFLKSHSLDTALVCHT